MRYYHIQYYYRWGQSQARVRGKVVGSRLSHGGVLRQTRMLAAWRNESVWKAVASAYRSFPLETIVKFSHTY